MTVEKVLESYLLEECMGDGDTLNSIQPDTDLFKRGIIDSLGILRLVAFMEDRFHISVPEEKLRPENFCSIRALSTLVKDINNSIQGENFKENKSKIT